MPNMGRQSAEDSEQGVYLCVNSMMYLNIQVLL